MPASPAPLATRPPPLPPPSASRLRPCAASRPGAPFLASADTAVMAAPDSPTELKRLAPVAQAAVTATEAATRLHTAAISAVPEKYKGTVLQTEQKVAALASPYVALLSDRAPQLLQAVDAKVDSTLASLWTSLSSGRAAVAQSGAAGLEQLTAARQAYLKRVEESVAFVREQGLQGTTKAAADALVGKLDEARRVPGFVVTEVSDAWAKLAAMPAVERLLAASKDQVDAAWSRYKTAHDALVADPRYASAVAKGADLLSSLQASSAYKVAAGRLSPLLSPYAESAARMAGPYVAAAAAHLAPVAA